MTLPLRVPAFRAPIALAGTLTARRRADNDCATDDSNSPVNGRAGQADLAAAAVR
jgi:hypothetical protein